MITKKQKRESLLPYFRLNNIYSVNDIKRKHKGFWFSKDTMRFFKSKLVQDVFPANKGKVYFVSSEKGPDMVRKFSVRCYNLATDSISTVGEFGGYETKTKALTAALNVAYDDVNNLQ